MPIHRGTWTALAGALAAAGLVGACGTFTNAPAGGVHVNFPLLGPHDNYQTGEPGGVQSCEECHVDRAQATGGVVDEPDGWVSLPPFQDGCNTCHGGEFHPHPCGPAHNAGAPCDQCHVPQAETWWSGQAAGVCDTGEPPPAGPHEILPLSDVFPIDGGHAGLGCTSCHPVAGQESDQAGQARMCIHCHARPSPTHYPPEEPFGAPTPADNQRDCKACHASMDGLRLVVPATFTSDLSVHDFLIAHAVWDAVGGAYRAESVWVDDCTVCHTASPQTATNYGCTEGGCHSVLPPTHNQPTNSNPTTCAQSACHTTGQ